MALRITQNIDEVIADAIGNIRPTQIVAEVIADAIGNIRPTQIVAEVIADLPILSNNRLTEMVAEVVANGLPQSNRLTLLSAEIIADLPDPCLPQLTGHFEGPDGNPLANGFVLWRLTRDSVSSSNRQVSSGIRVRVNLDSSGNVIQTPGYFLWANSCLSNSIGQSEYLMKVYTHTGHLVLTKVITVLSGTTFSLSG